MNMDKIKFKLYLQNSDSISSKSRSVTSRISKAKKAEELLNIDLDDIVSDKQLIQATLHKLKKICDQNDISRAMLYAMSNAIRQYYTFRTGYRLPKHFTNQLSS